MYRHSGLLEDVTTFRAPRIQDEASSPESTAALQGFMASDEYNELRKLVSPEGYLRVVPALTEWAAFGREDLTFFQWRYLKKNLKNIVESVYGMALTSEKPLIWPRVLEDEVEAWGTSDKKKRWRDGVYNNCWLWVLNATLLDKKTPLFKQDTENGDWVMSPTYRGLPSHIILTGFDRCYCPPL